MKKLMNLFSVLVLITLTVSCQKDVEVNVYTDKPMPNILPVDKDGNHYGYEKPFIIRPVDVGAPKGHQVYSVPVWCRYENSNMEVSYKTFGVQFIDHRVVLRTDVPLYRLKVGVIMDYYITRFGMKCREYFVDVYLREVPIYNQPYCKYTFDIRDVYDALTYDYHGNPSIRVKDIEYTYKDDTVREVTYGLHSTYGTKEFIELPRNILEAYR